MTAARCLAEALEQMSMYVKKRRPFGAVIFFSLSRRIPGGFPPCSSSLTDTACWACFRLPFACGCRRFAGASLVVRQNSQCSSNVRLGSADRSHGIALHRVASYQTQANLGNRGPLASCCWYGCRSHSLSPQQEGAGERVVVSGEAGVQARVGRITQENGGLLQSL